MNTFRVKNFERFQHYKDRAPPWIKLYNELLDDYEFGSLPDATKMHLIAIWLLASRSENKIPYDAKWVARRINANDPVDLKLLVDRGFILLDQELQNSGQIASTPQAECLSREEGQVQDIKQAEKNGASAPPDPSIPERDFFFRGREVLGKGSGGLIAKLLKAKGGNVALARAALEQASQKENPTEYVAAVCRGPPLSSKPLTEFQRKQQETNDVRANLREIADSLGRGGKADRLVSLDHGQRSENVRGGAGANLLALPRAFGGGGDRPGNGAAVAARLPADDETGQGIS